MLSLSPARSCPMFPLLIISRELLSAAPPAPCLTFPGMKQSTNVRRLSATQQRETATSAHSHFTDRGKKHGKLARKSRKGKRSKYSILSERLLPCSELTACPCITEAQLAPSICHAPTHFLPYFMEMVELFNLHIDWQREILGA